MDYGIFNLCMWSFCMCIHTGDLNLLSHLHGFCREFAQNLTLEKLEGTHLANNGHPSVRTPRSIVHHQLFYRSYLPVTEAVHSILLFRNSTHHLIFNRVIRRHTCKVFRMEFFRVSGWASCEHSMAALMWAQGPNLFICVARSSATVLLALRLQLSTKHRATCARKRRVLCSVKLLTLWQAQNVYHQWVPQNVYHQWVPQMFITNGFPKMFITNGFPKMFITNGFPKMKVFYFV